MTALERVKEARHLLTLVEEEAKQHEDDYCSYGERKDNE